MLVRPFNDIGVSGNLDLPEFIVGQTREKTFTVNDRPARCSRAHGSRRRTTCRPCASKRSARERWRSAAMPHRQPIGGVCDFTDLPAIRERDGDRHVPRAEGNHATGIAVYVSTAGDVVVANDSRAAAASRCAACTDLELRVGARAARSGRRTLHVSR